MTQWQMEYYGQLGFDFRIILLLLSKQIQQTILFKQAHVSYQPNNLKYILRLKGTQLPADQGK